MILNIIIIITIIIIIIIIMIMNIVVHYLPTPQTVWGLLPGYFFKPFSDQQILPTSPHLRCRKTFLEVVPSSNWMLAAKRTQSLPVGDLLQEALWQGTGSVVCLKMGYTVPFKKWI